MSCRRRKLKNLDGIQPTKTIHHHDVDPPGNLIRDDSANFTSSGTDGEKSKNVKEWWRNHQKESGTNDFVGQSEQANTTPNSASYNGDAGENSLFRDIRANASVTPSPGPLEHRTWSTQERAFNPYQDYLTNPQNGMVLDPDYFPIDTDTGKGVSENPSLGIFQTKGRSDSDDGIEFFQPEIVPSSGKRQQDWALFSSQNFNSTNDTTATTFVSATEEGEEVSLSSYEANRDTDDESPQRRKGRKKLSLSKFMAKKSKAAAAEAANTTDFPDHLSDLPSDIDPLTRERYLVACQMLKMSIIQKESALIPIERDYILSLLEDFDSHSMAGSELSVDHINSIERAALKLENESLLTLPNDGASAELPSPSTAARAHARAHRSQQAGGIIRAANAMSPGSDKNPHTATRSPKRFVEQISNGCQPGMRTPALNTSDRLVRFDGWSFQNLREYPFLILDTDGYKSSPRVFTPGIMEALRGFMPMNVMDENFWLRFSLTRDGNSFPNLLASVRASTFTMIGIETSRGEVFGSFTGRPWKIGSKWYGSREAFLWRLKHTRYTSPRNSRDPQYEREIEVYPCTEDDGLIQYCTAKTIAVGGGEWQRNACPYGEHGQGIGLVIDGDLAGGETNSCATFANPRLARHASTSNEFVISNLEVWSMTPCDTVEDATKFEMRDFFLRGYDA